MNDLTARIDTTVEMLLNREAQHVTALFPDQSCALRALLVEARAQIAAQAEALAAERERANILAWNNDGHAEWMTEHHQDLLRELPLSETTAQLGRLLDRWQRTPGQRQYVALSEVEGQREALARAEGLIGAWQDAELAVHQAEGMARTHPSAGHALVAACGQKTRAETALNDYLPTLGAQS